MYSKLCKPASDEAIVIRGIGKPVFLSSKQLILFINRKNKDNQSEFLPIFFVCIKN